ncbi:hypothetical protein [Staphylococcus aureus]|uniref:hypothetical protein n=1 Tax=Staphylococcus aureus TaxID=1280 RepID=UPI00044F0FB4|nr:hypothetical protein [Staphylococcus aureus]EZY71525.1 hypothetical protein V063_01273 [Staphylococcus aureus R0487]
MGIFDTSLLSVLVPSGGLGFITFLLFNKMGKVKFYDNQDKVFYVVVFSLANFIIMLVFVSLLKLFLSASVALLFSLTFTLILAVIYPFLMPFDKNNQLKNYINDLRDQNGLAYLHAEPVSEIVFNNNNKDTAVYIFDFDKSLINCGFITNMNTHSNEPNELLIEPFDEESSLKSFDDILAWTQRPGIESKVLINLSEKTQIYFIEI